LSLAFNILIGLIAVSPALALWSGAIPILFQTLVVAIALVAMATNARHLDALRLQRATEGVWWIPLLVPLCIVVQLLPAPTILAHPVWNNANEALGDRWFGHITIDRGATTSALFSALSMIGLIMVTIGIGRERWRAELILLTSGAAITLPALTVILQNIEPIAGNFALSFPGDVAVELAGIGLLLNLALLTMALERRETRHQAATPFLLIGIGAGVGLVTNTAALLLVGPAAQWAGVAIGVALFAMLVVIRRLDLGRWLVAALAVAFLAAVMILLGWLANGSSSGSALLHFVPATTVNAELERMLADVRWLGSGAGTFATLARLYQDSEASGTLSAPSTAAAWAIEIGWLGLVGAVIIAMTLLARLLSGALRRGRDWFYSGAAAGAIAIAAVSAFMGDGLHDPMVSTVLGIIVGLGLTQGFSQSARS